MGLNQEKNGGRKSRDTLPLRENIQSSLDLSSCKQLVKIISATPTHGCFCPRTANDAYPNCKTRKQYLHAIFMNLNTGIIEEAI